MRQSQASRRPLRSRFLAPRAALLVAAALLFAFPPSPVLAQGDPPAPVIHGRWEGIIGPVTVAYVARILEEARSLGAEAVVLEIDTPGGLDTSMRDIIKDILAAATPVIVYVHPSGARAASAGVFIAMAAHVAAMTPGTNIGAAHPVAMGGAQMDSTMIEKVTNDAAAYARSLAARRARNGEWAEAAVRQSVSATAAEAVELNIVDLSADSVDDLLGQVDGRMVELPGGSRPLHTAGAVPLVRPMNLRERLLAMLADPNLAYIFMLLGVYGLIFELQNPGAILPGVIGVIALVLAFMSFQTLPINFAGLALIGLAVVLFVLEAMIVSHGLLTAGGVVAMLLGSLMLFDTVEPALQVSLALVIFAVAITALFFVFVVGLGLKAQKERVSTGHEGLVGERGSARSDIDPSGRVTVHGEVWRAESQGGARIEKGTDIEVVAVSGLSLQVRPAAAGRFASMTPTPSEAGD